jgi:hypothetical protein
MIPEAREFRITPKERQLLRDLVFDPCRAFRVLGHFYIDAKRGIALH